MKVKTRELTGQALSWAVAKTVGYAPPGMELDWCYAGPLMEKYKIGVTENWGGHPDELWIADACVWNISWPDRIKGPTQIIAAMRLLVYLKFKAHIKPHPDAYTPVITARPEWIEVPSELLQDQENG